MNLTKGLSPGNLTVFKASPFLKRVNEPSPLAATKVCASLDTKVRAENGIRTHILATELIADPLTANFVVVFVPLFTVTLVFK